VYAIRDPILQHRGPRLITELRLPWAARPPVHDDGLLAASGVLRQIKGDVSEGFHGDFEETTKTVETLVLHAIRPGPAM
jgi:hypothetical protein